MKEAICPVCKRPFDPQSKETRTPLCSERCRLIDLGRWFGEEYRIPARSEEDVFPKDEEPSTH